MSTIQSLRKALARRWRPFAVREGCRLWGRLCPFPLPSASCLRRGWAVLRRLALLWNCSVPFFCEQPAVCSGRLIFSLSLLLAHSLSCCLTLAPSDCPRGLRAGPYPKQCRPLLSVPPPLAGGWCGHLGYFSAACHLWVLFIFPPS